MSLPRSITIPAALALAVFVVLGGVLFWQLDNARALLQRTATVETESGKTIRSLTPLTSTARNDDSALGALRRGDLLALRGEWTAAQKEYQSAVDDGGGLTALRKLAQAQLQRRDIEGARDTLKRMRSAGARNDDLVLLESIIHLRSGETTEARRILDGADDTPQKQYGLALLAIVEERHDDARTALASVLGGWEPTLRSYAKTILSAYDAYALLADSPTTYRSTLVARALADVGECELALPILGRVLMAQDDYRDAWIVQGFCHLMTERFAEAKTSLERAYQIDPQKPETQYFLARTYAALKDHASAITYAQYALQNGFTPAAEARRFLAAEAFATDNTDLALQELDQLTRDEHATVDAYVTFVTAAINAGRNDDAYARAQEAVTRFPESADAYEALGWSAQTTDRTAEARTAYERAIELDPTLQSARDRLRSL